MTKPVLLKENIHVNCPRVSRRQAIDDAGQVLLRSGYIDDEYIAGMHRRDQQLSVYIGNMIAIPHGEYEVREYIKESGIVVMIYPEGIQWGDHTVKIVVGIAGIGEQHMHILANCAIAFEDIDTVEKIVTEQNIDWIYNLLAGEQI